MTLSIHEGMEKIIPTDLSESIIKNMMRGAGGYYLQCRIILCKILLGKPNILYACSHIIGSSNKLERFSEFLLHSFLKSVIANGFNN